jgi:hypothetical protein
MKNSVVRCWGERLKVREGSMWGEYCVGEGKEEEKTGGEERSEAMVGHVVVLQGGSALRECNLDKGWYQER